MSFPVSSWSLSSRENIESKNTVEKVRVCDISSFSRMLCVQNIKNASLLTPAINIPSALPTSVPHINVVQAKFEQIKLIAAFRFVDCIVGDVSLDRAAKVTADEVTSQTSTNCFLKCKRVLLPRSTLLI